MRPRFAFLHIPKVAGSTVTRALTAATGDRSVCPAAMDRTLFGGFGDFDLLDPARRSQVHLGTADDLASHDVVIGHYSLQNLRHAFEPQDIATLLREPRARLLSLYTFWRGWRPERHDGWLPYQASQRAAEREWPSFLTDPSIAAQTDNVALRMVVGSDPRIPVDGFIDERHHDELVDLALGHLGELGHVGVIDSGPVCWARLGSWLDTELDIGVVNQTVDEAQLPTDWDHWIPEGGAAVDARTAADSRLWAATAQRHAAAGFSDAASVGRFADEVYERQAIRVREIADRRTDVGAPSAVGADREPPMRWADVARLDPIWLNLGGRGFHHPLPGYEQYVAVDLVPPAGGWAVAHDLRDPIPLPDGSVQRIITEDFIEHLPIEMLAPLLAECHRLLRPGGTMRIGCPDYNNPKDRYAFDGHPHDSRNPEHITRTDRFLLERLLFESPFSDYRFVQYWDGDRFVEHRLDESLGLIRRCPANDPRCRRDGWRTRLRGLLGDGAYLLRNRSRSRLGELRARPGRRWHVTSLIIDITR